MGFPRAVPKKRAVVKAFYSARAPRRPVAKSTRDARQPAAAPTTTRQISTAAIDWSFTLRPISVEHIERLGGAAKLPPISVWESEPGRYRGIDGYHRWRLAKHRGEQVVDAIAHHFPPGPAGEKAFEVEAIRSNLQHGLPLSRDERNRAIARLWNRWGRSEGRPEGHTLDEIGQLFNLTKQRIHQILLAQQAVEPDVNRPMTFDRPREPVRTTAVAAPSTRAGQETRATSSGRLGTPGRFSTFGRFSAATRRLRNLLRDVQFMQMLVRGHGPDATAQLRELRGLIDEALASGR